MPNSKGPSHQVSMKFRPQHNETILSFEYWKLLRQCDETTEVWMGRLRTKATECIHKENDQRLKEQFINRKKQSSPNYGVN